MDLYKQMEIIDKRNKLCKVGNAPITKKSWKAKSTHILQFNLPLLSNDEDLEFSLRQVLDRKRALYKIMYPFLTLDQIQKKAIDSLGLKGVKNNFGAKNSAHPWLLPSVTVHPTMMLDFHSYYQSCVVAVDQSGSDLMHSRSSSFRSSCDVSPAAKISVSLISPEADKNKDSQVFKVPLTPPPIKAKYNTPVTLKEIESSPSSTSVESAYSLFADLPESPKPKPKAAGISLGKVVKKRLIGDDSDQGVSECENTPASSLKTRRKATPGNLYHSSPMKPSIKKITPEFLCQSESSISADEDRARFQKSMAAMTRKRALRGTPLPAYAMPKRRAPTPLVERNTQLKLRQLTPLKRRVSLGSEMTCQDSLVGNRTRALKSARDLSTLISLGQPDENFAPLCEFEEQADDVNNGFTAQHSDEQNLQEDSETTEDDQLGLPVINYLQKVTNFLIQLESEKNPVPMDSAPEYSSPEL
ncbi:Hypothetical predicted protein [Cloeon dipterum]|uniref:Uncharacterized protein n=1 Tax=Cloeon dipterum TaxID=197152 RepID=A0A8S1DYV6_9INSE|nr:Hypothetical predicted protein [Cloeon dipterum]